MRAHTSQLERMHSVEIDSWTDHSHMARTTPGPSHRRRDDYDSLSEALDGGT